MRSEVLAVLRSSAFGFGRAIHLDRLTKTGITALVWTLRDEVDSVDRWVDVRTIAGCGWVPSGLARSSPRNRIRRPSAMD